MEEMIQDWKMMGCGCCGIIYFSPLQCIYTLSLNGGDESGWENAGVSDVVALFPSTPLQCIVKNRSSVRTQEVPNS